MKMMEMINRRAIYGHENSCPVLVIDDDNDLCKILAILITRKCSVHFEHTLKSAEAYLILRQPAIIFLDNNLPDGVGVASIKKIVARYPGVKLVLMTADTTIGLRERALSAGASFFVAKPFKGSLINQIIFSLYPGLQAA